MNKFLSISRLTLVSIFPLSLPFYAYKSSILFFKRFICCSFSFLSTFTVYSCFTYFYLFILSISSYNMIIFYSIWLFSLYSFLIICSNLIYFLPNSNVNSSITLSWFCLITSTDDPDLITSNSASLFFFWSLLFSNSNCFIFVTSSFSLAFAFYLSFD